MNNKTKEIGQWTCEGLDLCNFASILLINRLLLCKYSKAVFSVLIASFILKIVQNTEKGDSFLTRKLFLLENDLFPRYKTMNNNTKQIGEWTCEGLALRNFASILLINRLLLCKYSKAVFSVFIARFTLKIVQNTKKGLYFLLRKLFLVENDLFPRYKMMNNKTKEIGQWTCEGFDLRNFTSILLINQLPLCKYSKAVFSLFIASFILKIVQNTEKGVSFLTSKLFLVENDLFPRYKTMNNKTKEIGEWTCEGLDLRNFASILLINQPPLWKYSKAVFSVFIASFILNIFYSISQN